MSKGMSSLGSIIRTLRLRRGLEQKEFADRVGTSQGHLSKIENGAANPSLKLIKRIADGLQVDKKAFFDKEAVSMENEEISYGHLDSNIREFISREDSPPWIEFSRELYDSGFTVEELEALKLIFISRKRK